MNREQQIDEALRMIRCDLTDGDHHKMWLIDQIVRVLTDCPMEEATATDCNGKTYSYEALGESREYREFVRNFENGEDGPKTYEWDTGISP